MTHFQSQESVVLTGEWTITKTTFNPVTGLPISRFREKLINRITNGGLANMAALLIGEVPSNTAAMHVVIGDNPASAQDDDTVMEMGEVFRTVITARSRTGGIARFRTFFGSMEANGDHKCVGIVARSTNMPESGELLNRLVQPFSKADNQVMTIECRIKFQRALG